MLFDEIDTTALDSSTLQTKFGVGDSVGRTVGSPVIVVGSIDKSIVGVLVGDSVALISAGLEVFWSATGMVTGIAVSWWKPSSIARTRPKTSA